MMLSDIDPASGSASFKLDKRVKIEDEFFITVDGFPVSAQDTKVNFAGSHIENGEGKAMIRVEGEWKHLPDYSYHLYPHVSFSDPEIDKTEITVDDVTEPIYYTLQGIRVPDGVNLASGIYIAVKGKKAYRILVK